MIHDFYVDCTLTAYLNNIIKFYNIQRRNVFISVFGISIQFNMARVEVIKKPKITNKQT